MPLNPTSPIPARITPATAGFTLLELIVVLLIIGVLLAAIGFAPPTRERQLQTEAERLVALLKLAQQETLLTAAETAVGFHAEGYIFYRLQGDQWRPLSEGLLRPRRLDPDFRLELRFPEQDDAAVQLPWLDDEEDERQLPRLYLLAGGEVTPFELTMAVESISSPLVISADLRGQIALKE